MTPTSACTPLPRRPTLPDDVVDVVSVDLEVVQDSVEELLVSDERMRADRLVRPLDRRRWVAARVSLRHLVGRYVGIPPSSVAFGAGPYGKPSIAGQTSVRFSFSHSGTVALCALARDAEVGVDVEDARRAIDVVGVAERVFGASEVERLKGLPEHERTAAFLRLWTRHEAAVKCVGTGLGTSAPPPPVWITDLTVVGMPAAVACEREPRDVRRWSWDPGSG